MKKLFTVAMMFILLATIGCKSNKDKILGKWGQSGYSVEFRENGTYLISASDGGNVEGKWELQGDDVLKTEAQGESGSDNISFTNDDTMTLTNSNGTGTWTRIKEEEKTGSNDQSTPPAEDAIQVSIKTLKDEYSANQFKADSKYKGKLLLVTGKIVSIGQDMFSDAPVVVINEPANPLKILTCNFDKEDTSVVANLTEGQTITVVGVCDEGMLGPDLFHTVVQQ